jgi:hypothetical protein
MTENGVDLALDGNAAADLLQEIFVLDITIAQIQCEALPEPWTLCICMRRQWEPFYDVAIAMAFS